MIYFKVILILGLICTAVSGRQVVHENDLVIPEGLVELGSQLTARAVSWLVIQRLKSGHFRVEENQQPRVTFPIDLPQFPEEISLPPVEIPLDFFPPSPDQNISGLIGFRAPRIVGLADMEEDLVIGYDLNRIATISMSMQIPSLSADSDYLASVLMQYREGLEIKDLNITGEGLSSLGLSDFYLTLLAKGHLPISSGEYLSLDQLKFDFGFENAFLITENLELNGNPINLDTIAKLIKALYEAIWVPNGPAIIASTRCLIDHAINDCVILDLISGVYDCLKLPLKPECFGPQPTEPTEETTVPVTRTTPRITESPATSTGSNTDSSTQTTAVTRNPNTDETTETSMDSTTEDSASVTLTSSAYTIALVFIAVMQAWAN